MEENKNIHVFPNNYNEEYCLGMTLRDYFAAKAMPTLIDINIIAYPNEHEIAVLAYKIADAMIKER